MRMHYLCKSLVWSVYLYYAQLCSLLMISGEIFSIFSNFLNFVCLEILQNRLKRKNEADIENLSRSLFKLPYEKVEVS